MKIGLYLPNESYRGVDLSRPDHGNPGIGGTEYNFLTLPYYFNYFYKHITFICQYLLVYYLISIHIYQSPN